MFGQDETGGAATGSAAGSAAGSATGQKKQRNRQKKYATQEAKVARDRELRQKRAAAKAGLEERFLQHRAGVEKRRKWVGPRKFGEWMRALAERELDQAETGSSRFIQLQEAIIAGLEKQLAYREEQLAAHEDALKNVDDYIQTKWQKQMDAELARRPPPEIE